MFDIKAIRENPELFDRGLARRGFEPQSSRLLDIDARLRALIGEVQEIQTRRNDASKQIGAAKAKGDNEAAQALIDEVADLKEKLHKGEEAERALQAELREAMAGIPNIPADDTPEGADEADNELKHTHGTPRELNFEPKEHFDIGEALGLMDFETAAKLSGARFVVLKGQLARMERALASFMLDIHTNEFGYEEIMPPNLVRDDAMFGTGQLPKFADDLYKTTSVDKDVAKEILEQRVHEKISARVIFQFRSYMPLLKSGEMSMDDVVEQLNSEFGNISDDDLVREALREELAPLWLIPTAEVPLTNLVREDILNGEELPKRFTAYTPCFRSEAGAAGRDTRGMIRQHQFSKVELVSITTAEQGPSEHERMLSAAEEVLKRLELPYRVMTLCTGDMGFAAQKTFDIEVWLPGQNMYREISSCSLCGDFQARRMNARYRLKDDKKIHFAHTLNGSGLAIGRTIVAILENYQQADGSVAIPAALQPYMGGHETIEAKG